MTPDEKISRTFYIIFLALISLGVLLTVFVKIFGLKISEFLLQIIPPCIFRETLGIYCPGCGGVRSLIYLTEGDFLSSLWYHPFVLYAAVLIFIFVILYTMSLFTEIKTPKVRPVYLYIGAAIILIQWIIKLIFLIGFSTPLIPF
ncbi:MAG: DUF2752 domain-containing protein [Methanocorpusculum sp.]|nr:DUF2752 domain-containing protein [Methanocorpusculum sp.]